MKGYDDRLPEGTWKTRDWGMEDIVFSSVLAGADGKPRMMSCLELIRSLVIRDKKGRTIPFVPNAAQMHLYHAVAYCWNRGIPIRFIVLKARQIGFSTMIEAIIFVMTVFQEGKQAAIVADKTQHSENIFRMAHRYYDYLPGEIVPKLRSDNQNTLEFEGTESSIQVFAAGVGSARSSTINYFHGTEYAFWQDAHETLVSIDNAIDSTDPHNMMFLESTANGFNSFRDEWVSAVDGSESVYIPLFFPWYQNTDYVMPYTGFAPSKEELELKSRYGLTLNQLSWRRFKIASTRGGTSAFEQENPATPEEAFLKTGSSAFDSELVLKAMSEASLRKPLMTGEFECRTSYDQRTGECTVSDIEWKDDEKGPIRIYQRPISGFPYVIGGDPSAGGSDYSVGQVILNTSKQQVAVYRKTKEYSDKFALQLYCLGKTYNDALIGTEVNMVASIMDTLANCGYPNLYQREADDTIEDSYEMKYGVKTTVGNKKQMIDRFSAIFRENPSAVCDYTTLSEMQTFVLRETYNSATNRTTYRAENGMHDDTVMALAIAYWIADEQSSEADASATSEKRQTFGEYIEEMRRRSRERESKGRWQLD